MMNEARPGKLSCKKLLAGSGDLTSQGEMEHAGEVGRGEMPDAGSTLFSRPLANTISAPCMPQSSRQKINANASSRLHWFDGTTVAPLMPEVMLRTFAGSRPCGENYGDHPGAARNTKQFQLHHHRPFDRITEATRHPNPGRLTSTSFG